MWTITRALCPTKTNPDRLDKQLKEDAKKLNWNAITFPVSLNQIDKFERPNPTISVNVFGYGKSVYPLRISKHERENQVDLLLISDGNKQHYCLIKNMSRLLSSQVSKHKEATFICRRCLNPFKSVDSINNHKLYCSSNEEVKVEMPKEGSILKFKSFFRQMRVPFVVSADFECTTEKLDTNQPNPKASYTKQYQKHTPSGFCYYIKCFNDKVCCQDTVIYTKQSEYEDIAQIFLEKLEKDITWIYKNCGRAKRKLLLGNK